jgi:beta-lactam-binding protein with PASTA domain
LIYPATPTIATSEKVPAGAVISITPPVGTKVAPDHGVVLVVSSGHAPVKIADVTKLLFPAAQKALLAQHFTVTRAPDDFSSTVTIGRVISTEPAIGTAAPFGSAVVVHISKGPDLVEVPDVTFETFSQAKADLQSAGLSVGTLIHFNSDASVVMDQSPSSGRVARGTSVDLAFNPRTG